MNKSLFILLSTLTMSAISSQKDELRHPGAVMSRLPVSILTAHYKTVDSNSHKAMPGKGLRGGGPAAGAWGYSATKTGLWSGVAVVATYGVVQTGGALAPLGKIALAQAAGALTGSAAAGELAVAGATVIAKAGIGAKIMGGASCAIASLGSLLPWAIEGASITVGGVLGSCPFLP